MFGKNEAQLLLENGIFEASCSYWTCNIKAIAICPNQQADPLTIVFSDDSFKIKKGLELVSKSYFSQNFSMKNLLCNITQTGQN